MSGLSEDWKIVELGQVCEKTKQADPRKEPFKSFTYIDVSSVSNESFRIVQTKELLGSEAPSRARKVLKTDDIIFATVRPTLKRVAIVPSHLDGQICSTGYCVVRPSRKLLDPSFVYFQLLTEQMMKRVETLQKGVAYPAISDSELLNTLIKLPPLPQQRAIARALRAVQEARESRLKELQLERERKAAMMQYLFTHGTQSADKSLKEISFGKVPARWDVLQVGELCKSIVPGRNKPKRFDGDIPWITTPDLKGKIIIETSRENLGLTRQAVTEAGGRIIPSGSVVMSCVGEFGVTAIAGREMVINQQLHAFVCGERIDAYFLAHALRMQKAYMESIALFTTLPYLNKNKCESIPVPVPPISEQLEISALLKACDNKISALEIELFLFDELFRAMLEELMTGRLSTLPLTED